MDGNVTPFAVSGSIDYDKLIKDFGVEKIDKKLFEEISKIAAKKNLDMHLFLRRGLFFAQRDLKRILKEFSEGKKIFLYTGRAPGGEMHIGHLIPFLFSKFLQDLFDANLYIQIPDDEKYLYKKDLKRETVEEMTKSDLIELSAFGFDPDKTFIFKNTEYIKNIYPLYLDISKKISYAKAAATFGFNNNSNIGMIAYPSLQIIPTFFEKNSCLIPCGIDQDPYFRLQRDFAEQFGFKKSATILSTFLSPLTGKEGKMSASDPDKAILLTDSGDIVKKKVNKYAFSGGKDTLEEHRLHGGDTSIDVAYQWLYYIFEEDDDEILRIKKEYESGRMLSGEIKKILIEKITLFLKKREEAKKKALANNLLDKYMYSGKLAKEMWKKTY